MNQSEIPQWLLSVGVAVFALLLVGLVWTATWDQARRRPRRRGWRRRTTAACPLKPGR